MATAETPPPEVEVTPPLDQIRTLLRQLTFPQKLSLNAELAQDLRLSSPSEPPVTRANPPETSVPLPNPESQAQPAENGEQLVQVKKPYRSFYGILKGSGPVPSAEDIDEMRREAWANFPREEFYE